MDLHKNIVVLNVACTYVATTLTLVLMWFVEIVKRACVYVCMCV